MNGKAPIIGNTLTDKQRELQELRKEKENKRLRMERDILKKGFRSASLGQPERLSLISQLAEQDKQVNKSLLCKLFGVMKSSYYYGLNPKPISLKAVKTKALIRQIFNDSNRSAGGSQHRCHTYE
ncbi:mobile element protein [Psychrobacter sp. JCM 18903]|uniref:hypothetical protein n=1 Tax=Psychrobacter sp. JCM 18903 TaxID=1298610 RepID=UPI0004327545|nr:hypothetical protein [Psychrobacter sp. JCM 18903]GAF62857.1 mobile element protein [Psychrobacter sp. JCM 18903]